MTKNPYKKSKSLDILSATILAFGSALVGIFLANEFYARDFSYIGLSTIPGFSTEARVEFADYIMGVAVGLLGSVTAIYLASRANLISHNVNELSARQDRQEALHFVDNQYQPLVAEIDAFLKCLSERQALCAALLDDIAKHPEHYLEVNSRTLDSGLKIQKSYCEVAHAFFVPQTISGRAKALCRELKKNNDNLKDLSTSVGSGYYELGVTQNFQEYFKAKERLIVAAHLNEMQNQEVVIFYKVILLVVVHLNFAMEIDPDRLVRESKFIGDHVVRDVLESEIRKVSLASLSSYIYGAEPERDEKVKFNRYVVSGGHTKETITDIESEDPNEEEIAYWQAGGSISEEPHEDELFQRELNEHAEWQQQIRRLWHTEVGSQVGGTLMRFWDFELLRVRLAERLRDTFPNLEIAEQAEENILKTKSKLRTKNNDVVNASVRNNGMEEKITVAQGLLVSCLNAPCHTSDRKTGK